jgi:transposase
MGRRQTERQQELWVAAQQMAGGPRHVFYERLNRLLSEAGFDPWIEARCAEYYCRTGRDSIPPGTFFRMLFIGYFEGIDSQRGIAWRCDDSLSLRKFLGFASHEETPDHSSLSRIRCRLPKEVFDEVHQFVLQIVNDHKLLDAKTVGVDATTLEANAAMKSIVRRDSGEDWEAYLKRLAAEDGIEIRTKAELIRFDKDRNKEGQKKVSNDEWVSPADPDARIAKMKDGTTHLAYKAEHVVDLKHGVILAAEIYHAHVADSATLSKSLTKAQDHLEQAEIYKDIEKVAADKGYHKAEMLAECEELGICGIKPYIPEPERRHEYVWTDKPPEHERAVRLNRQRTGRKYGKQLQRQRSEVVERTFAHVCETGGARRSWLKKIINVGKRYLLQAAAHNLGVVLRKLLGAGKPREFAALWALCAAIWATLKRLWHRLDSSRRHEIQSAVSAVNFYAPRGGASWPLKTWRSSTGC